MKYIYSQLTSNSVLQLVKSQFELESPISCVFYTLGLHDNYLVGCKRKKYIFRIYRNSWRTEEEILFEIELLSYLKEKSANVATPIKTRNEKLITYIESPEGVRIGVLFNYADGYAPSNNISIQEYELLGASVANIHEKTENFKTKYKRKILDLPYLVDNSLMLIAPFLNPRQMKHLKNIKSLIYANISYLKVENSDFGICTGDINLTNFHINKKNIMTHFDFDQCGYGYRAFELGKFSSSLRNDEFKYDNMHSFIKGYESIRKIADAEKMAIPYFEIVAIIWVMSIHASNADKIGHKYLDNDFWNQRIENIDSLMANPV